MVYTWDIPTYVISQTYFKIYLVYDTVCHISKYVWDISSESFCLMSGICQGYSRHIFSESFGNMSASQGYVRDIPDIWFPSHSAICQGYTRHIPLLVNRPGPAVAMRLAGCFALGTGIVSVIVGV